MSQKYIGNKEKLRRTEQKIAYLKRELKKKDKIIEEMAENIEHIDKCKDVPE